MGRRGLLTFAICIASVLLAAPAWAAEQARNLLDSDTGGSASCGWETCVIMRVFSAGRPRADISVSVEFDRTRRLQLRKK
jgi:hypothetical protein